MRFGMMMLAAAMLAGSAALSQARANMLLNPGFESDLTNWSPTVGDPAPQMNDWRISTWSGDQRTPESAKAAVLDVKSTVDTGGGSYWNLLAQVAFVTAGESYNVSAWERTAALAGHSESWIEVQFLASDNSILQQFQSAHVTTDQGFTQMSVTDSGNMDLLAPMNAVAVRVQAVVEQRSAEPVGNIEYHVFDDFSLTPVPEPAVGATVAVAAAAVSLRRVRRARTV